MPLISAITVLLEFLFPFDHNPISRSVALGPLSLSALALFFFDNPLPAEASSLLTPGWLAVLPVHPSFVNLLEISRTMPRKHNTKQPKPKEQQCDEYDVVCRIAAYEERVTGVSRDDKELLIPALALRSYHLPGYGYCDDWLQYFQNNHPLISLVCHHRLHPIKFPMRLVFLIGSIVFGLTLTNISWLWFFYSGTDQDEPAVTIYYGGGSDGAMSNSTVLTGGDDENAIEITQGMLFLWTIGAALHALFDNTIWYITACVCCIKSRQHHRFKCWGSYCVILTVLVVTAIATLAVLLRVTLEQQQQQQEEETTVEEEALGVEGVDDDAVQIRFQDASSYSFLLSYSAEMVLALLVYYPIVGTILFSGILGCGKLPILGGRPYEVMLEEKSKQRQQRQTRRLHNSSNLGSDVI